MKIKFSYYIQNLFALEPRKQASTPVFLNAYAVQFMPDLLSCVYVKLTLSRIGDVIFSGNRKLDERRH